MFINKVICNNCHGSGYLAQYNHIDNGICYDCGGTGLIEEYSEELQATPNPKEYYKQYKMESKKQRENNELIYILTEQIEDKKAEIKSFTKQLEAARNQGKYDRVKDYYNDIINELHEEINQIKEQIESLK